MLKNTTTTGQDIDLTQTFIEKMNSRPRTRGRYNASELYFINNGQLSPEDWLHPKEKDISKLFAMWAGNGMHDQLQDLLGKKFAERKMEIRYNGITLVGKVDYEPQHLPDDIWEFKTSEKRMKTSRPWHDHQVRLYCTMFEKVRGHIYQPVRDEKGLYLKHLKTVYRNDKWFEQELKRLYQFHLEVEKIWEKERRL